MKAMPEIIKINARNLRQNMTNAEKILWEKIRRGNILKKQFLKQKPIMIYKEDSGMPRYIITDFYCAEKKLIIELDGNIHDLKEILLLDKHKQNLLEKKGYKVIRFQNEKVFNNIDEVLKKIRVELE